LNHHSKESFEGIGITTTVDVELIGETGGYLLHFHRLSHVLSGICIARRGAPRHGKRRKLQVSKRLSIDKSEELAPDSTAKKFNSIWLDSRISFVIPSIIAFEHDWRLTMTFASKPTKPRCSSIARHTGAR
jgi:hypothetical protein